MVIFCDGLKFILSSFKDQPLNICPTMYHYIPQIKCKNKQKMLPENIYCDCHFRKILMVIICDGLKFTFPWTAGVEL